MEANAEGNFQQDRLFKIDVIKLFSMYLLQIIQIDWLSSSIIAFEVIIWKLEYWSWGELPYERGGDARQKFWIKFLKETNLGVA